MTAAHPAPNWYDVLDVDPAATTDEVREAWRAAIADLTPADRRFRLYNEAAEVLLDPQRRADYDATLAPAEPDPEPAPVAGPDAEPDVGPDVGPDAGPDAGTAPVAERLPQQRTAPGGRDRRRLPLVPGWLVAGVAILTALSLGLMGYLWTQPSEGAVEAATGSARTAAERAAVPLLSYDYRTLDEDQSAAHDVMTSDYRRDDYDPLFEVIRDNAPASKTVVDVEVIASAVVRAGADRAEILLFLNRPTTNKTHRKPVVYKDQARLTMQKVGDEWLVDELKTAPTAS